MCVLTTCVHGVGKFTQVDVVKFLLPLTLDVVGALPHMCHTEVAI